MSLYNRENLNIVDFWHIELKKGGCFQADTLQQAIARMVQYYVQNDREPESIVEISGYCDGEVIQQISAEEIAGIQESIEGVTKGWSQITHSEFANQNEIQREYLSNLI